MKRIKYYSYICGIIIMVLANGCHKVLEEEAPSTPDIIDDQKHDSIPEGHFVVSFSGSMPESRSAVSGPDTRVQHVRYLVYKSTGEFVKTKEILLPGTTANWPLGVVRDTLPRGSYKAVFLGNVEKTLFPYALAGVPVNYSEVLQNYDVNYNSARIVLPNSPFQNNSEYYLTKADFSDTNPTPTILLQRIIGLVNVHRNLVDAQIALNKLVQNIVTQVGYKNIIQTQARGLLKTALDSTVRRNVSSVTIGLLGGIDAIVNPLVDKLVAPVTDTLYNRFLKQLTNQIGNALAANENQGGLLGVLGALLNPWEAEDAHTAIVSIKDFPKSVDYNLVVQEKFNGINQFRYKFTTRDFMAQKSIAIKNFSGLFNIQKIHVIKEGLISGLLWNGIIDNSLLLEGTFVDITDSLKYTPLTNRRYASNYSFVDLGLKSYTQQTDGNHSLSVSVKLLEIGNIDGLLGSIPILGTILNLITNPIKQITIRVPLNLPLLGVENLSLSGGWSTPATY